MTAGILPTQTPERPAEAEVAADVALLRRELARALGVEGRPSLKEVTEAYHRALRAVVNLRKEHLLEEKALEVLTRSLTTLYVQALVLSATEALFDRRAPAGAVRRWLEVSLP